MPKYLDSYNESRTNKSGLSEMIELELDMLIRLCPLGLIVNEFAHQFIEICISSKVKKGILS